MRIGQSDAAPAATPNPQPQPEPARPARPAAPVSTAKPLRSDGVDRDAGPFSTIGEWAKDEWPAVTGLAHGLASAPGIIANAFHEAAAENEELGAKIERAVDGWQTQAAATRATAIDDLHAAAKRTSPTASRIASDLHGANRLPQAVESAAGIAGALIDAAGRVAGAIVAHEIDAAPSGVRGALRAAAGAAGSVAAHSFAAAKTAVKGAYDSTINALPADVERDARSAARIFTATAAAQEAKAGGVVAVVSSFVGRNAAHIVDARAETAIGRAAMAVPGLRETPFAGFLLAGAATATDVATKKASVVDATVANVGSTLAGTVAGGAATTALSSAIGGGAAEAAGVAVAAGPVGWAVVGGVVVGAGVGYGVYKAVESDAGQHVVDGIARLDGREVAQGATKAGADAARFAQSIGAGVGRAFGEAGHFLSPWGQ